MFQLNFQRYSDPSGSYLYNRGCFYLVTHTKGYSILFACDIRVFVCAADLFIQIVSRNIRLVPRRGQTGGGNNARHKLRTKTHTRVNSFCPLLRKGGNYGQFIVCAPSIKPTDKLTTTTMQNCLNSQPLTGTVCNAESKL